MTNEDVKQWIENLIKTMRTETSGLCPDPSYKDEVYVALKTAIKALEQQPCEEAVSRRAVHDLIAELLSDYLHDEDREKIEKLDVKIEDLEPVTPKEKTGHWEQIQYIRCDGNPGIGNLHCSECNRVAGFEYKYCPNCGARMVSE